MFSQSFLYIYLLPWGNANWPSSSHIYSTVEHSQSMFKESVKTASEPGGTPFASGRVHHVAGISYIAIRLNVLWSACACEDWRSHAHALDLRSAVAGVATMS